MNECTSHLSCCPPGLSSFLLKTSPACGGIAKLMTVVWQTTARTTGDVVERLSARQLWRDMAEAAWRCADPGLQFDDTVNKWHTCKATDRIYASNPCSEFMFLDDTACNLASLNLLKFLDEKTGEFDVEGYKHACRIFFLAQEIAVDLASYPTKRIAERSHPV